MGSAMKLTALICFIWSGFACANIIFVPGDYPTIQAGIDASGSGDTIMVSAGIYPENLVISHSLSLVGGHRDNAIIEGNGAGDVILIQASAVNVRNFTIGQSGSGEDDAGVKIVSSDSCAIELCRFSGNHIGLSLYNSGYNLISGCIFEANVNGLRFWEDINNPGMVDNYRNMISNNIFDGNGSNGIWFDHAMIHHTQNTMKGNRIIDNTIGINMIMSLQNEIYGNHIENNVSLGIMHGICEGGGGQNNFHHNNLIGNNGDTLQACNWGVGDDIWFDAEEQEGNHWSNYTGPDNNGDGIGDIPMVIDGYNCEDTYPLMVRLTSGVAGMVYASGYIPISGVIVAVLGTAVCCTTEYHGGFGSMGLDAGNYDISFSHPNYQDTVVLGVITNFGEYTYLDIILMPQAGIEQAEAEKPVAVSLNGNHPNPFNANTSISFALARPGDVRIEIYDLLGRQIETLADDYFPAGVHQLSWDAAGRASGLYFYKLSTAGQAECRSMTLLK